MNAFSNYLQNRIIDGMLRGGALTSAGAAGSTAVCNKGIWTATTSYSLGDLVVPHANMTGAGGKFLLCTTAGTSGSTNTLAIGNPGTTVTDNSVAIWTVVAGAPALYTMYYGLCTTTPSASGGGTEVSGSNYSRASVVCSMANLAGTQGSGTTTSSTGTSGQTSDNNAINFPTPSGSWGTVVGIGIYDQPTGGNLLFFGALNSSQTINSGNTVSFAAASWTLTVS